MKRKHKIRAYFLFIFVGGGILLFKDNIEGNKQIIITVMAVCVMMFGLYKVTAMQKSNSDQEYENQEYFNREKYEQQEETEKENKTE